MDDTHKNPHLLCALVDTTLTASGASETDEVVVIGPGGASYSVVRDCLETEDFPNLGVADRLRDELCSIYRRGRRNPAWFVCDARSTRMRERCAISDTGVGNGFRERRGQGSR